MLAKKREQLELNFPAKNKVKKFEKLNKSKKFETVYKQTNQKE